MSKDQVLSVAVDNDELVIRIGIATLAGAAERADDNNPYDAELEDFKQQCKVTDQKVFAEDVAHALCDEGEDGSTPLTRLLDRMFSDAISGGSFGVEEIDGDDEEDGDGGFFEDDDDEMEGAW